MQLSFCVISSIIAMAGLGAAAGEGEPVLRKLRGRQGVLVCADALVMSFDGSIIAINATGSGYDCASGGQITAFCNNLDFRTRIGVGSRYCLANSHPRLSALKKNTLSPAVKLWAVVKVSAILVD
ncbi:hypothetical protein BX600DRAFT_441811 [Xylariales sp. PMI_506]|nr:hypothetical protein BX600DRAFT_441811 [Xylariales sp. PMI_506]